MPKPIDDRTHRLYQPPGPAPTREACLVLIYPAGPLMGSRYPLGDAPLVIGRGEDCGLALPEHTVSRRHALVARAGDGFQVTDLGSTNGTAVNHAPVTTAPLR